MGAPLQPQLRLRSVEARRPDADPAPRRNRCPARLAPDEQRGAPRVYPHEPADGGCEPRARQAEALSLPAQQLQLHPALAAGRAGHRAAAVRRDQPRGSRRWLLRPRRALRAGRTHDHRPAAPPRPRCRHRRPALDRSRAPHWRRPAGPGRTTVRRRSGPSRETADPVALSGPRSPPPPPPAPGGSPVRGLRRRIRPCAFILVLAACRHRRRWLAWPAWLACAALLACPALLGRLALRPRAVLRWLPAWLPWRAGLA